jgi:hypothetical protein
MVPGEGGASTMNAANTIPIKNRTQTITLGNKQQVQVRHVPAIELADIMAEVPKDTISEIKLAALVAQVALVRDKNTPTERHPRLGVLYARSEMGDFSMEDLFAIQKAAMGDGVVESNLPNSSPTPPGSTE